ncbi:MAG: hypothetical protein E6713_14365 [Sporomusaceae bacterium]|nr:hypothetical protein [Sporomusaceae bacterium]
MKLRQLVRGSLLLALALVFQSLRLMIPIPPMFTTFLIGTLVNSVLLFACEMVGLRAALFIAWITPLVAFAQQMLPLPVFILPVALANSVFLLSFYGLRHRASWLRLLGAATLKTVMMYSSFVWLLSFLTLPAPAAKAILFVMSWPQFITGVGGGILALFLVKWFAKFYTK